MTTGNGHDLPYTPRGHLYIGLCSNRSGPTWELHKALEFAAVELFSKGWLVTKGRAGSSDIEDGRNQLFTHFYNNPQFTDALFVDDDVHWDNGAVWRLVNHPVDFVLGAYPKRMDGEGFPISMLDEPIEYVDPVTGEPDPTNGLLKIAGGPGGFLRITRAAAEKIVAAEQAEEQRRLTIIDKLRAVDPYTTGTWGFSNADIDLLCRSVQSSAWYHQPVIPGTKKAWNMWEFTVTDHIRRSEDKHFCHRWRSIGGTVWCDPHLTLYHTGEKTWAGCFAHYLQHNGLKQPGKVIRVDLKDPPTGSKPVEIAAQPVAPNAR